MSDKLQQKERKKTKVALHQYGVDPVARGADDEDDNHGSSSSSSSTSTASFPSDWPSGHKIQHMVEENIDQDDTIPSAVGSHKEATDGNESNENDDTYWQASARWALLRKYGYLPDSLRDRYVRNKDGSKQLVFSNEDMDVIQQTWEKLVTEAQGRRRSDKQHSKDDKAAAHAVAHEDTNDDDLMEFLITAKSGEGRQLQWTVMDCPPATQFKLHAHPNLELIYCARGELHEIRMSGKPYTKTFRPKMAANTTNHSMCAGSQQEQQQEEVDGPNLVNLDRSWYFDTLHTGQWLVNEVGSIHKSFTATNGTGCVLVVLWGGSHADVADDKQPTLVNVPRAVNSMDDKLSARTCRAASSGSGCCNGEALLETFLPESEKAVTAASSSET